MSTESVMDHHLDALLAEPFDIEEVLSIIEILFQTAVYAHH